MATTFKKSQVKIGNIEKTVVVVNYKEEEAERVVQLAPENVQRHHIQIYDRSGSMSGSINELIDNLKQTVEFVPDNDYITVIWFSGPGEHKILLKGAKKDANTLKLLDSTRSTIGCTCFSEALQEAGEVINDLKGICPNIILTLFTDGNPVVPWGSNEEYRRVYREIGKWSSDVLAINTIGYGNYYDQEFLKTISLMSDHGMMYHSRNIEEYFGIFENNVHRVKDIVRENIKVSAPNSAEILYINGANTIKLGKEEFSINTIDRKKNQFVIVGDGEFEFKVNDTVVNTSSITNAIPSPTFTPVMYAYAYASYYLGHRERALDILAHVIKDKALVDAQVKAFTFDECADYSKMLSKAAFNPSERMTDGECPEGYIPSENATCVMDILKILVEENAEYIYTDGYKRVTRKSEDAQNLFKRDDKIHSTPMTGLVIASDKLNISIRSELTGTVELNHTQAKRVGLDPIQSAKIYRNQTIVKDGYLNIEQISVIGSDSLTSKLSSLGISDLFEIVMLTDSRKSLCIDLTKVPVANRMYGKDKNFKTVAEHVLHLTQLEASVKVVSNLVKKYYDTNLAAKASKTQYTPEQLQILNDHGLDGNLVYNGVDRKTAEKTETDFYEARIIDFGVTGMASLPSVADVMKKIEAKKEPTKAQKFMAMEMESLMQKFNSDKLFESSTDLSDIIHDLEARQAYLKKAVAAISLELATAKIAKALTGSWYEGLEPGDKGTYVYNHNGEVIWVKTEREKIYF